jgi:leader peptidase (prepilin peptidase)/N-methyltransferase
MDPASTVFTPAGLAIAGVLGLVVGSFLNVVIHRVPRGESIVAPRSRCPGCATQISARDNVPVLSWLVLRGRCRACRAPISPRYPLVEAFTGIVFAGIAAAHGAGPMTLLWWIFASGLVAAAGIDFDERWIPDSISLGGLGLGLAAVPAARALAGDAYASALLDSAFGAALGGGLLWLTGFAHARVSVALGRQFDHWPGEGAELPAFPSVDYFTWFPGLGFGDVKLMGAVGAFLGPAGVAAAILLAAAIGLCFGVASAVANRDATTPFGFGPAIAIASLVLAVVPLRLALF